MLLRASSACARQRRSRAASALAGASVTFKDARSRQPRNLAQSAHSSRAEHAALSHGGPADIMCSELALGRRSEHSSSSTEHQWPFEKCINAHRCRLRGRPDARAFARSLLCTGVVQHMVRALKARGACAGALRPSLAASRTAPWPIFFVTARESPRCEPPVCPALPAR